MKKLVSFVLCFALCLSTLCFVSASAEEYTADVVVVGAGTSGLNAAVFAAKNGADVLLLEKLSFVGGSGLLSSGALFTCNSDGIIDGDDSIEHAFAFWKSTAELAQDSGYPDWNRLEYTLEKTGDTVRQLIEMGANFTRNMSIPTGSMVIHEGGGAGYINSLKTMADEQNVRMMMNTTATELITEGDVVVGVKAICNNEEVIIRAKTVILATGGFARDQEKVNAWIPECADVFNGRVVVSDTGDGFDMALAVGAVLYDNPWMMMSTTMPDFDYNRLHKASSVLSLGTSLAVNEQGVRFTNEAPAAYSGFGNAMAMSGCKVAFALMNATEATAETLAAGMELGEVVKGDSVAAIAEQLDMDASALEATVARYNELCEKQTDDDFGKASANLIALDTTDLYAVRYYATSIGTIAGVVTNENHEVLREDGSVIEGLLAIGEMSNRAFYNYHYVGGASLGLYSTMGRLAGEYAAQRAK